MSATTDEEWHYTAYVIDIVDTVDTTDGLYRIVYVEVLTFIIDTNYIRRNNRNAPGDAAQEAYYMTNGYDIHASFLGYGYGGITIWTGIMELLYYAEDIDDSDAASGIEVSYIDYDQQSYYDTDNYSDFEGYAMSS